MIWYFSGTGNSRWVAQELARRTDDQALDLTKFSGMPSIEGQVLGLVFPIHAWSVPQVVEEFLKKLSGKPVYAYAICTCREDAGMAMDDLKQRFSLNSVWSIALPSNYLMGADLEPEELIQRKFRTARTQLDQLAADITARQDVTEVSRGSYPRVKTSLIGRAFKAAGLSTRSFRVTDACIGCQLCAKQCPAEAITMVGDRPQWTKRTCYLCTACLNRCPTQAIEYGSQTKGHHRYRIEDHLPSE